MNECKQPNNLITNVYDYNLLVTYLDGSTLNSGYPEAKFGCH